MYFNKINLEIRFTLCYLCYEFNYFTLKTINKMKNIENIKISKLLEDVIYGSYKAQRDYGLTHDQLLSIGLGNEVMKVRYESKDYTQQIPIL